MKHIYAIPAALAAAVSAASCMSYTYMTTSIHPDLSADRTVYTQADSSYLTGETDANQFFFKPDSTWDTGLLEEPFRKDFHEEICIMNIYASRHLGSLAEGKLTPAEPELEGCPVLAPEETAQKHFRWFSTVYEYKAVYRRIEGLPVDLGEFMDRETQEFFLRGGTMPGNWNGLELYSALEEMNSDFMEWYVTSTFKVSHDIIQEMCGVRQRGLLEELSGKILEEYIKETESNSGVEFEFRKIFGITSRALTKSEKDYFRKWSREYGYYIDIVSEAFDIAASNADKNYVKYADKILSKWFEAGLRTLSECRAFYDRERAEIAEQRKKKKETAKSAQKQEPSRFGEFNIEESFRNALDRSYKDD